jgi:hypothetical protein
MAFASEARDPVPGGEKGPGLPTDASPGHTAFPAPPSAPVRERRIGVLLSHSHRFIFIHVYKTGGTSIRVALEPFAYLPEWPWWQRVRLRLGRTVVRTPPALGWHPRAVEVRAALPADVFAGYFKFAFVRNPWDWQVSLYHYVLEHPEHDLYPGVSQMADFEEFLLWRAAHDRRLQTTAVTDAGGSLLVDFLGRFENLREDFATACSIVGVRAVLGHLNESRHGDYRSYYTPRTVRLVEEHWAEDIERFGYTFEGPRTPSARRAEGLAPARGRRFAPAGER